MFKTYFTKSKTKIFHPKCRKFVLVYVFHTQKKNKSPNITPFHASKFIIVTTFREGAFAVVSNLSFITAGELKLFYITIETSMRKLNPSGEVTRTPMYPPYVGY